LFAIAPKLFSVVFGEQWITSAQYVQILIPFYFLRFVSSPLSSVLLFDKNQAQYLKWQITHVIAITTGLLLVSLYLTTPNKILLVYSVINVLSYIYLLSVSFRSAGTNLYNLILSLKYMDRVQRT